MTRTQPTRVSRRLLPTLLPENEDTTMARPLRSRIWFHKPDWTWDWLWIKTWAWKPTFTAGDEFNWHTRVFGFPFTGQVVFATHPCDWTGACAEDIEFYREGGYLPIQEWPIDIYGNDHSQRCHCGGPVACGYDGNPTHSRGMCWECDAVRCDAYPGACIESAA